MTLPDHGDQLVARSKREVIALALRDWIHETPMSQCNTSVDICPDWPLAFEVAHRVLVAMDQREAHIKDRRHLFDDSDHSDPERI